MTHHNSNNDNNKGLGPVIEIWVDDHDDGSQSVFLTGERSDGQRFFGSFFQPTLDHDQDQGRGGGDST